VDGKGHAENLSEVHVQAYCLQHSVHILPLLVLQAGVTHYTIDRPAIAALLQRASGVPEAGALLAEPAMGIDM
jgi:hypothetical protein